MRAKERKREQREQTGIYLNIVIIFQLICILAAYYNKVLDAYVSLAIWLCAASIAGIVFTIQREGNAKIVLYASMLLSVGFLIQAIIQPEDGWGKYQMKYLGFLAAAAVLSVVLWFVYGNYYYLLEYRLTQILLCICCFLIIIVLWVFGVEENGAKLWLDLGVRLQPTEVLKPVFIVCMAGMVCRKKKLTTAVQILAVIFCGALAGLLTVVLHEFGTALVIGLTGLFMIYIFQNTKVSGMLVALLIFGVFLSGLVYIGGNWMYQSFPKKISEKTFASNLSATGNKEKLARILEETLENTDKNVIAENEEKMGFTYSDFIFFLRYVITDEEVNNSYLDPGNDKKQELNEHSIQYMEKIEIMAAQSSFREAFQDEFLNKKMYKNRMLAAYRDTYETENGELSWFRKAEYLFFRYYMEFAGKIQERVRGFLYPEEEAADAAFQVNYYLSIMAGGGAFGNGPEIVKNGEGAYARETDMVFSMVVAELGGIVGILVILLNMLIFKEAVQISLESPSPYQKGVGIGIGICWFLQAAIIIAGNCRLLPLTGITLPLISSGGTSLVISILMIVLLVLISVKPMYTGKKRPVRKENGRKNAKFFEDRTERRRKSRKQANQYTPFEVNTVDYKKEEKSDKKEKTMNFNKEDFRKKTAASYTQKKEDCEEKMENQKKEDLEKRLFDDL